MKTHYTLSHFTRRLLILCFITVVQPSIPLFAEDTLDLRTKYYASVERSRDSDKFYESMKTVTKNDGSIKLAYKGMSAMLLASHAFNPMNKLSYFNEGRDNLEEAIKLDPKSIELRFLRFTIQDNAPFFLDYSDKEDEDEKLLLEYLKSSISRNHDIDLSKRITKYFLEERSLKKDEKKMLQEILNEIDKK